MPNKKQPPFLTAAYAFHRYRKALPLPLGGAPRPLPLPLGEVPRRGGEGVLSYETTPSQSKIKDFCQLSQGESQAPSGIRNGTQAGSYGFYRMVSKFDAKFLYGIFYESTAFPLCT